MPRHEYVVFVPDGCADEPIAELGDKTPLDVAAMPHSPRLPHAPRSAAPPSYLRDYRPAVTSATWRSSGSIRALHTGRARIEPEDRHVADVAAGRCIPEV